MRFSKKALVALSGFLLAFVMVPVSHAQLNSNNATVNLNAILAESLTVAAGPATVNFALVPNGPVNGDNPVSVTTTWALGKTRTTVKLYAYFTSANALTDGVGDNIPTTKVTAKVNGVASGAFTNATPFGANGMLIFNQAIGGVGTFNSSHGPDTIALTVDTTGLALPAATYTGILNVEAQAI